jgi:hypothetical protein
MKRFVAIEFIMFVICKISFYNVLLRSRDDINGGTTPGNWEVKLPQMPEEVYRNGPYRVDVQSTLPGLTSSLAYELQMKCNAISRSFSTDPAYDGWATIQLLRGADLPPITSVVFDNIPDRIAIRVMTTSTLAIAAPIANVIRLTLTPISLK